MKKIFLAIMLIFSATSLTKAQTFDNVTFLGVDYSAVNVLYADETSEQFISAFERINQLMISEPEKYDVAKYLNIDIKTIELKYAIKNIATLQSRNFTDLDEEKISIESVVASYPEIKGTALLLIARELNKAKAIGQYDIVVFNGQTKEILKIDSFVGDAGGFGLRNFWAGSIYKGLEKYLKLSKKKR
ncbi:MAG: hypothetical protein SNG81_04035 [Rikenellaceae bacterium]